MSAVEAPQAPANPGQPRRGQHHGRRRQTRPTEANATTDSGSDAVPRQHGRRVGRAGRNAALAMRPASLPPTANGPDTARPGPGNESAGSEASAHGRRGNHRGGAPRPQRMVRGRSFGGRLTNGDAQPQNGQLQAEAVEFVPGQPLIPANQARNGPVNAPRPRRPSKSTAPDIMTRTHEDIEHCQYECPICTSEVQRNSKVWSCHSCWTVFHLTCVKKWASNEGSAAARRASVSNGEVPPSRQWRCPGCNLPKDELPKAYTCWCGKEHDPKPPTGIPPHSCGNTCGRDRVKKCPHPCQLTCHAGPCGPCTYMGPSQSCFCGKNEVTKRCADTDYENGWSCGEPCGDVMPCGLHTCPRSCHEGLCGACAEPVEARCYCGQERREILCSEQGQHEVSSRARSDGDPDPESWTGVYKCSNRCDRLFDCGHHRCEKPCHSQNVQAAHCPRSPDLVSHCSCGKTSLSELDIHRESCRDPIPNCDKQCAKALVCGHVCEKVCHSGDCPPCFKKVDIPCVCGRTVNPTICHQGSLAKPQCMRVCRTTLSCGRHACEDRCCPGERKAIERQSTKKKSRPLGSAAPSALDLIEAEHICTRVCNRPLRCGNHTCEDLCHKGPCHSCREAIFDEVPCHCGRTRLDPPLPCGTQPPPCRFQCERPKSCGHPQVSHNCHLDLETCPKCPFLVSRRCMCGKQTLKSQPCFLADVRCGQVCGRKLSCGRHACRKPCHRPGECEDAGSAPCRQPCGLLKTVCGHPDEAPCHAPYPCKEDKACQGKTVITCACQTQKQEMRCLASRSSPGNAERTLPCDDECARLERNRKLASALRIDASQHVEGGDHVPYSDTTLDLYLAVNTGWAMNQEREFRVFAADPEERRLRFKPMKATERAFLHALAEDYGLDSESLDPEPHRHVLLLKTPRFVCAPSKTVGESVRVRERLRKSAVVIREERRPAVEQQQREASPPNAFVISAPRFGLTVEEVKSCVGAAVGAVLGAFEVEFLPSEEIVVRPTEPSSSSSSSSTAAAATERKLRDLLPALKAAVRADQLGAALQLCTVDASLNILRRETDLDGAVDGWSRVAAKGAAPRRLDSKPALGGAGSYAALSGGGGGGGGGVGMGKVTFAKKKEKVKKKVPTEAVVDDWEKEMEKEGEEEERLGGVAVVVDDAKGA